MSLNDVCERLRWPGWENVEVLQQARPGSEGEKDLRQGNGPIGEGPEGNSAPRELAKARPAGGCRACKERFAGFNLWRVGTIDVPIPEVYNSAHKARKYSCSDGTKHHHSFTWPGLRDWILTDHPSRHPLVQCQHPPDILRHYVYLTRAESSFLH